VVDDDGPVRQEFAPAPGGQVLVLRQNVNAGWEATQDGARLTPVTVDGWQQGWRLESDDPGDVVTAEFAPDRAYRTGLLVGAVAFAGLLAAVLVLLRGRRRSSPPALETRVASPLVLVPFAVAGFGLVAGWAGVVVAAVAVPLVLLVDRRLPDLSAGLFAVPCLAAGTAYALRPWGDGWAGNLAWPHYLLLVSLASALAVLPLRRPRRPTFMVFRRRAGRSTSR
jgi:arabinofuranan 3-O-arabinosyltransferase